LNAVQALVIGTVIVIVAALGGVLAARPLIARRRAAEVEREAQRLAEESAARAHLEAAAREAHACLRSASDDLLHSEYLATSEVVAWQARHGTARALARNPTFLAHLPSEQAAEAQAWSRGLQNPQSTVDAHNARFVMARLAEEETAFDRVERYPLTDRQRRAIVTAEDATLVVAGAGTGKTSVIVGKVDYLIRRGLARPGQILVVAFARKAAEELGERLGRLGHHDGVAVSTFHALGLQILGAADGRRPSLSPLAEDPEALRRFLRETVAALLANPVDHALLLLFFSTALREPPTGATVTGDAYIRAELERGTRALTGQQLKSHEEVLIANWLTLNGIRWEYERPYPVDTATTTRRQYQPDFYLPDHDLYLEHFGIDERGDTRPGIDRAAYHEGMAWKRALHQQHGTRLVETYSHFSRGDGLAARLAEVLAGAGVVPRPPTDVEVTAILAELGRPFAEFIDLLAQFLKLYRGNGQAAAVVEGRARTMRDRAFLRIFAKVHERYAAELARAEAIDFDDMITQARERIRASKYVSPYTHLIVDEFQDIAANRLGLLTDLRAQVPHARLFAVGDDWQAIYRFAGADFGIIADLATHVGPTARVDLDTTFRYGQELLDATAAFVTRNPRQLRKTLRAHDGPRGEAPLCLVTYAGEREAALDTALTTARRDLLARHDGGPATVFLLGRYGFSAPDGLQALQRAWARDGLTVSFHTAHAAKGKEADYVVVLGLEAGTYGFPAQIADDPVLQLVLVAPEPFAHAEERRLFYVALTRARRRAYLIAPADHNSTFIRDDLLGAGLRGYVITLGARSERHRCPTCQGQTIRRTEGRYGAFWACAHYPLCDGKLETCDRCRDGALVALSTSGDTLRCTTCGHEVERCPRCRQGRLVERTGRYGAFLACSRWQGGAGCQYTRNT
jgi:DNA helicase-4